MFRKLAISCLLLVYLTVTTGFSVATHFCNNKLAEVSFNKAEKPGCGQMDMPMDCCKDNHIKVKVSDNHEVLANKIVFQPQSLMLFDLPDHDLVNLHSSGKSNFSVFSHSPPLNPGVPLNIFHSVFRI